MTFCGLEASVSVKKAMTGVPVETFTINLLLSLVLKDAMALPSISRIAIAPVPVEHKNHIPFLSDELSAINMMPL